MIIIRPETITEAKLTSINIAEDDYVTWSSSTSFDTGERCISTTTHKVYESLIDSNLDNDPTDQATNSDKWKIVSSTNRWKLFDNRVGDQATRSANIEATLNPDDLVDSLAIFNLTAESLNVTVTDDTDGEVYNKDFDLLDNSAVADGYTYFFEPIVRVPEIAIFDIPPYRAPTVKITLTSASTVGAGEISIGSQFAIGETQVGTFIGIDDFSTKEVDDFGVAFLAQGKFSQRADFRVLFDSVKARTVQRVLTQNRASTVVFSAIDSADGETYGTLIIGFYRDFDIYLGGPAKSRANIQVRGLT